MFRTSHLIAAALLAPLALGLSADDRPAAKAPDYPPGATEAQKREIDLGGVVRGRAFAAADAGQRKKLADAFPFVSLEDRLTFDGPGRARVAKAFPTPDLGLEKYSPLPTHVDRAKLPPAGHTTLLLEDRLRRESQFDRMTALAAVHQVELFSFLNSPGFGVERLVWRPSRTPEVPPKDWSEADRGEAVSLPAAGSFFTAGKDKKGPTLPSVLALSSFHASTTHEFAHTDSMGLVKDKTKAAGFQPHAIGNLPDQHVRGRYDTANPTKDKDGHVNGYPLIERWAVRKVELIGLLMHDAPVAYLNREGKLPTMDAVKDAGTRDLTEFEANALKDLAAGKEVIAVDAVTNQVRMVGAIRMAQSCLKCHDGKRGDLLGAFSYDLVRDPAFVRAEK